MINLYLKEETALVKTATIYGINGPVIYLKGNTGFCMSEMVYVGKQKLVGEVIALDKDLTTVQVYEETTGLYPGEEVIATGNPVSVTLAPGILNNIFDGIERPLERIAESAGAFITRGVSVDSLDRTKKWPTHITVKQGDYLHAGDIIAEVPETHAITHKCMVPPGIEGTVLVTVADGEYTIDDLLWTRTDYEMPYYEDKIVITGHTPTQTILGNDRPGYIYRKYNHIALDCGACSHNGRLAGICLETGKEYYSRE